MTRAAKALTSEIEFIGPPQRLISVGALPDLAPMDVGVEGAVADFLRSGHPAVRLHMRRGSRRMKLKLRPETPPGDYPVVLRSGGERWQAMARVQPFLRAQVTPSELSFRGAPGETATCLATLANEGNVPIELPKFALVGIFDDDGIETAFASTYRENAKTVDGFLSTFTSKLREAHGGLMKLRLVRGAGAHPSGTVTALEVAAELPGALAKGHRYHGIWTTDFANIAVSVTARS
jgi:hypothetical protein